MESSARSKQKLCDPQASDRSGPDRCEVETSHRQTGWYVDDIQPRLLLTRFDREYTSKRVGRLCKHIRVQRSERTFARFRLRNDSTSSDTDRPRFRGCRDV